MLSQWNSNVVVLENRIPGWVCDVERKRRDRPAVGWAGGASHGADVGLIVEPVRTVPATVPRVGFPVGWHRLPADVQVQQDRLVFTKWVHVVDDERGYFTSPDWDIGLAPVEPCEFNSAKSALKALEYGALGIPVIASDWGPYTNFVRHGETGSWSRRDHEWLKYMSELAADEGLREKMGAAAREQSRQWTIEEGWLRGADTYQALF